MKILFTIALLALIGCAGNKPMAVEKQVDKCVSLINLPEITRETLTMPVQDLGNADTGEQCPCYETITCNNIEYCSAFKCSDGIHTEF